MKKDSKEAAEAADNLYGTIAGLTAQLAFVKRKLLAYEIMKSIDTERKAAGSYAQVAQRITIKKSLKVWKRQKLHCRKLFARDNKVWITWIVKRKEDIVAKSDTTE